MYSVVMMMAMSTASPGYIGERIHLFNRGGGCQSASASAGCAGVARRTRTVEVVRVTRVRRARGCAGGTAGTYQQPQAAPAPVAKPTTGCPDGNCPVRLVSNSVVTNCPCGVACACVNCACDTNALKEVNAARAARGLSPYLQDDGLTAGAKACAEYRAANRIYSHTNDDMSFLPPGVMQWGPPDRNGMRQGLVHGGTNDYSTGTPGFKACCMFDNYTHAGAWTVVKDGRCYHQILVR